MIVAGADVISYFWLDVGRSEAARDLRRRDGVWAAPVLWRSEFRNVLSQHLQHRNLDSTDAIRIATRVEAGGGVVHWRPQKKEKPPTGWMTSGRLWL